MKRFFSLLLCVLVALVAGFVVSPEVGLAAAGFAAFGATVYEDGSTCTLRAFIGDCDLVRWTAAADLTGGTIVTQDDNLVVVKSDAATGEEAMGIIRTTDAGILVPKKNEALAVGANVYWDADGDPQGGDAGSGALTATAADGDYFGVVVEGAAAGDERVRVQKLLPNPLT